MEKINFNQVRGFSDSITLTFNFIKQEFKPLLRSCSNISSVSGKFVCFG